MKKILIALMMTSLCAFGGACGGDDDDSGSSNSGASTDAGTSTGSSDAGTSGGSSSESDASTDSGDDACVAESDEDFCGSNECGSYSGYDNCGDYRTVDCGACGDGYSCSGNVCVADESGDSETCTETLNNYSGISDTGESYYYNYGEYDSDYEGLWELEYYSDTTDTYVWVDMNNGEDASVTLGTMSFSTPGYVYYSTYLYCFDLATDGAEAAACAGIYTGEDFFEMLSGTINVTSVTNTFAGSISNGVFYSWNSYSYDESSGAEDYCVTPAVSFSFSGAISDE